MSLPCRCVGAIIARSIALSMKRRGGRSPESIRGLRLVPYGWKHTHCQFRTKRASNSQARWSLNSDRRKGRHDRPPRKRPQIAKQSQLRKGYPLMTSFRQIEANRRNARKSTGPITEEGKRRSRYNAIRHGLTAETVLGSLEDAEDCQAFEAAVTAGFDAETAVERELVLRLASLLWRLRRATAIDTGLLETSSERDVAPDLESSTPVNERTADGIAQIGNLDNHTLLEASDDKEIARRFLQLDCNGFERLARYETALWRQVYQMIFVLDVLRRQNLDRNWLPQSSLRMRFRPLGSLLPRP